MNQRNATGSVKTDHRVLSKRDWNSRLKVNWQSTNSKYQFTYGRENESHVAFTPAQSKTTVLPAPSSALPGWKVVIDGFYATAFVGFTFALCAWLIFQMQFSLGNFWP